MLFQSIVLKEQRISRGLVEVLSCPLNELSGGGAVGVGFLAPTQTVQSYDYQKSLERQVLELRLIVAKLQLKLMQLRFPHLFK